MRATSAFELNDPRGVRVQGTVLALALRPIKSTAMALCATLTLSPDEGVIGDHGTSLRRQVTILDIASWNAACGDVDISLPWTSRRANILVENLDLKSLVGQTIRIGTALAKVRGEVVPCYVMDAAHLGLKDAMKSEWRGGVFAQILQRGTVKIDDKITLIHSSQ